MSHKKRTKLSHSALAPMINDAARKHDLKSEESIAQVVDTFSTLIEALAVPESDRSAATSKVSKPIRAAQQKAVVPAVLTVQVAR